MSSILIALGAAALIATDVGVLWTALSNARR